jgi:hypothetical protein
MQRRRRPPRADMKIKENRKGRAGCCKEKDERRLLKRNGSSGQAKERKGRKEMEKKQREMKRLLADHGSN